MMGALWNARSVSTSSVLTSVSATWKRIGALTIPLIRVPAGTYRLSLENLSWDTESPPPELCISLVSSADAGPLWAAEGEPDFFLDPVDVELPRGVQNGELALSFRCPQNHPGCVVLMSARLGIAPTPDRLT